MLLLFVSFCKTQCLDPFAFRACTGRGFATLSFEFERTTLTADGVLRIVVEARAAKIREARCVKGENAGEKPPPPSSEGI